MHIFVFSLLHLYLTMTNFLIRALDVDLFLKGSNLSNIIGAIFLCLGFLFVWSFQRSKFLLGVKLRLLCVSAADTEGPCVWLNFVDPAGLLASLEHWAALLDLNLHESGRSPADAAFIQVQAGPTAPPAVHMPAFTQT